MRVKIRSLDGGKYSNWTGTEVLVDGVLIGQGSYGGEPEDNSRWRDYRWVEPLLKKLAEVLGASVEIERVTDVEDY